MKKFYQITMAVVIISAIFAASAFFSSCNKFNQDEIARGYVVRDNGNAPRGAYWALTYEGTEYPMDDFIVLEVPDTTARRGISGAILGNSTYSFPAQSVGGTVELPFGYQKTDGTVDSVTVPVTAKFVLNYNNQDIFPLDSFVLTAQHTVLSSRTIPTFLEISRIHLELRNQDGVLAATADGFLKIFEDPADTIHIHDTTIVVEHDTVHHYDTTIVTHTDTVYLHDTIRVIQIDTVFGLDTVFLHDTIVRIDTVWWQDSTVVDLIHNNWNTPVLSSDSLKFSCGNQQITKLYRNGVLLSQTPENFNGYFSRKYSAEGSIRPEQIGMKLPFTAGQADFGSGLKLRLIGPQAKYTIPFSYRPQLIQLGCSHTDDSVEVVNGGLLYIGYDRCGSEIVRRTVLITRPNADTTTRRIIGRDTSWNGCGQVYQTWLSASATVLVYYITRTGVETVTYNVGSPLTVTNTVRDTTTYTYTVTVTGQGSTADVGTTNNFSGNTITFGGLSVTLTPYGIQNWCALTHTTGTLTSTGVNVTGVYNGSSRQTLIPVTFVNPPLFSEEVIMAVASDGYKAATPNVLSGDRVTSLIVIVAKHAGSSTTYWFYHGDWNTFATRADLDSVQITATEATYYSSQLLNDYYPAIVFNHNNPTQFKRGVVKSTYLSASSCWQLIYKIAEPGATHDQVAYTMSASAWTIAGDGGRNALRGVMTSTGSLTADGVTKQIY